MSELEIGIHNIKSIKATKIRRLKTTGTFSMDLKIKALNWEGQEHETVLTLFSKDKKSLKVI